MTWLGHGGEIEGVKIKGNAYFSEFRRLIALAQSNVDYEQWWDRANLGPVTVYVVLNDSRGGEQLRNGIRSRKGGVEVTVARLGSGFRDEPRETVRAYAAEDFMRMLRRLQEKGKLPAPPPLDDPALINHLDVSVAEDGGQDDDAATAEFVVEIHVPLLEPRPARGATDDSDYPWITRIEDFLTRMEEQGSIEVVDYGEEMGEVYVFVITGASEAKLLRVAARVAALPGVPAGTFAVVSESGATEAGDGRRVDLPRK